MWKELLTLLQAVLTLTRDQEQNRKEIRELNEKFYSLASAVRSLSDKIDANSRIEAAERKLLVTELQNELLKATQNMPRAGKGEPTSKSKKSERHLLIADQQKPPTQ